MQCPKCGSSDQLPMSDGMILCLDCRNEHDGKQPAPVVAPMNANVTADAPASADTSAILAATDVAEVLAAGDSDTAAAPVVVPDVPAATPPILAGRFITVRGRGGVVLVESDDDNDLLTCITEMGDHVTVMRSDVTYVDDDGTDPLAPVQGAETVSEDQPFDPVIFTVASLAITHGLACIGDDGQTLYNPRIGWLPPPCDQIPEAEQGVAYAIAVLVTTFGLDRSSVEQIAATLLLGATTPESELVQ